MSALGDAVGLAVLAAILFALAATLQNSALTRVVPAGASVVVRGDRMRALMRAPAWLA